MPEPTINVLLEYIWAPIVLVVIGMWTRLTGLSTRTSLLELAEKHYKEQRQEDRELREQQYAAVLKKLDSVERIVKNGH